HGTARGGGTRRRPRRRQGAEMRGMGDAAPLAGTQAGRLALAFRQHVGPAMLGQGGKRPTHLCLRGRTKAEQVAVAVGDREVLREVLVWRRSAANGEDVDQLDVHPRYAAACTPY